MNTGKHSVISFRGTRIIKLALIVAPLLTPLGIVEFSSASSSLYHEEAHDSNSVLGGCHPCKSQHDQTRFERGKSVFSQHFGLRQNDEGQLVPGLGLKFNLDSCVGCHNHPTVGGSSETAEPQFSLARAYGARNELPARVVKFGPALVARSALTGMVVPMFSAAGRYDAPLCTPEQDRCFRIGSECNLLSWRVPTPLYGLGLIEMINEATLLANHKLSSARRALYKIKGHANRSRLGAIGKFGWKAQSSSIEAFVSDAFRQELGLNEGGLLGNSSIDQCGASSAVSSIESGVASSYVSDVSFYLRHLAWPRPISESAQLPGVHVFASIGCDLCHTPSLQVGQGSTSGDAVVPQTVTLYSDLLVHDMGSQLSDNLREGRASPREFRTAPLWGLRFRKYLLHDGRARTIDAAIRAHGSLNGLSGSEAEKSAKQYDRLSPKQRKHLLAFLGQL